MPPQQKSLAGLVVGLGCQHGAHTSGSVGRFDTADDAVDRELIREVFVNDALTGDLIAQHSAAITAEVGAPEQRQPVGFAVIVDTLGFAFNPFIHAFAFLPEKASCPARGLMTPNW